MDWRNDIADYEAKNAQEASDQALMVWCCEHFSHSVLLRKNALAHITASAFILNPERTHALMAYHNIRDCWAWTGGHADGDDDLMAVAMREAQEETGIVHLTPIHQEIISLDVLPVFGHMRRGEYVSAHLHLNVTYLLQGDMDDVISVKQDENKAVQWMPISAFTLDRFDEKDLKLYQKLIGRA